jgi:signal transduction histidine kinase
MATFENLPTGKHVFEVAALDNQGNASNSPAKLEFSVFAPWYRTTGFLIFMSAAMLTSGHLGWLVFRHYKERSKLIVLLSNARVAAEAASRSKSEFLANMSHEIRTPMSGVIGRTDLALQCDIAEDVREYLETVKASGQSLLTTYGNQRYS